MYRSIRFAILAGIGIGLFGGPDRATFAGTIIKLNLGSVSPDIEFDGSTLSTADDGNAVTDGDQNTAAEFTDFLESIEVDIPTPIASFTIGGLAPSGQAFVFLGQNVVQNFNGGSFTLYAADDSVLLSGSLTSSALSGTIGFSAGGLFTTSFGSVTGGSLAPYIDDNTLVVSMNFTKIQTTGGPVGLTVSPPPGNPAPQIHQGTLQAFTADASINIEGEIPEPGTIVLLFIGMIAARAIGRRR
jgi:hypothetical protein